MLDANYTREGIGYDRGNFDWKDCHIPEEQLKWLEKDLSKHHQPAVVFIHQQLDGPAFEGDHSRYCPDNADKVRAILERSGKVLVAFQGHYHEGGYNIINGIPYYTLKAVIEGDGAHNNSYAVVEIGNDRKIAIKGYRKAVSKTLLRS